ncbi:hypothetical protein M2149_000919 [Lachnospiraceae bacterium PFB1-21]
MNKKQSPFQLAGFLARFFRKLAGKPFSLARTEKIVLIISKLIGDETTEVRFFFFQSD